MMPDFELKDAFGKSYKSAGIYGERGFAGGFYLQSLSLCDGCLARVIRLALYGKGWRSTLLRSTPISILIFLMMRLIRWSLKFMNWAWFSLFSWWNPKSQMLSGPNARRTFICSIKHKPLFIMAVLMIIGKTKPWSLVKNKRSHE